MAETKFFRDLSGKRIKAIDIINGINKFINDYLDGINTSAGIAADNGGVGTIWSGENTKVNWTGTRVDNITNEVKKKTDAFKNNIKDVNITAYKDLSSYEDQSKIIDVYNIITQCLHIACKVYWQSYSYYQDKWLNADYPSTATRESPVPVITEKYRGIMKDLHVNLTQYQSDNKPNKTISEGRTITPEGLDDFLMTLVRYNESKETNIHRYKEGTPYQTLNTCYSSCHHACHGSSRGRR